jgi:hypothetical protein
MELTGRKYAYYHAVGARYSGFAEAPTNKTSHYFLKPGAINGRIDVGLVAYKTLHELVHKFRGELYATDTVGELAATEGVAYNIDHLSRKDGFISTWNYSQATIMQCMHKVSRREMSELYDELAKDMYKPIYDDEMLKKWWRPRREVGVRMIDLVGIAAVKSQLRQGYAAADIWQLPAAAALGYEETYETAA